MKNIKLLLLLLITALFTSCYKEKALNASETEPLIFGKHKIDEKSPHYPFLKEVLDKYNVLLVYDGFSKLDMNLLAKTDVVRDHNGRYLTEKQVAYELEYLKQNLFNEEMLPSSLCSRLFKPFIYLGYDIDWSPDFSWDPSYKQGVELYSNGKDFWLINMQCRIHEWMDESNTPYFPDTPERYKDTRLQYYRIIFEEMINKKMLEVPLFLRDVKDGGEVDYFKPLNSTSIHNPDFSVNRGIAGEMSKSGDLRVRTNPISPAFSAGTPEGNFLTYICVTILYTEDEINNGTALYDSYIDGDVVFKNHPVFMDKYLRVREYMKTKYNWDIMKISQLPTSVPPVPTGKNPDPSELGPIIK